LGTDKGAGQLALDLRPYLEHREIVYAALAHAVDEGFSKLSDFADDVGKSTSEVSLRLRRAEDSKGYAQTSPLDFVATLAMRPGAREVFLRDLSQAWGYRLEPLRQATPEEKLRAVAQSTLAGPSRCNARSTSCAPVLRMAPSDRYGCFSLNCAQVKLAQSVAPTAPEAIHELALRTHG
jgi:hypothetical protein